MINLRHATPDDYEDLYQISVATGDAGLDARPLMTDHTLIGAIYSLPYAAFEPDLTWVAEDDDGVLGFVVGTLDTRAFETRLFEEWFPPIRARTPDPGPTPQADWSADQRELHKIHHPVPIPDQVVGHYPAHMHMNLLPRARGHGLGRRLFDTWANAARSAGADGVHIGAAKRNHAGQRFWAAVGFAPLTGLDDDGGVWMGQRLSAGKVP